MTSDLIFRAMTDDDVPVVSDWWQDPEDKALRKWLPDWKPRTKVSTVGRTRRRRTPPELYGSEIPCLFSREWTLHEHGSQEPVAYVCGETWPHIDFRNPVDGLPPSPTPWRPHMEILIAVPRKQRGRGFGQAALRAVVHHDAYLGEDYWLHINEKNEKSCNAAEEAGYDYVCTTEDPAHIPLTRTHHYRRFRDITTG